MANSPDGVTLTDWLAMRLVAALVLVVASIGAWSALLGWDDTHNADGTGPYQAWQVVALVLIVVALAAAAGWYGFPLVALLFMPLALGFAAFRDWGATDDSGLFMVGVMMITAGSFIGLGATAGLAAILSPRHRKPVPQY
jgi:hypothetical protein